MISLPRIPERARKWAGEFVRRANLLVPAALLVAAVWMRAAGWTWAEWIQHKAFDAFLNIEPRAYEEVGVRVIDLDDETLAKMGQWPWPRTMVAKLVRRLGSMGASAIAFDAVFAEPDNTSPARAVTQWPDVPELWVLKDRAKSLPDHDQVLAKAMKENPVVTGFVLTGERNDLKPVSKASFAIAGDSPLAYLDNYIGAVPNLPILEKAASGNGSFNFVPESDAVVRRAPLLMRHNRVLFPSLGAEALRVSLGAKGYAVKSAGASGELTFGTHTGISKIKIGSITVPTDAKGQVWIHYTDSAPGRTIPAWKIFEKGFDASRIKGAICFVGTSAAGLKDLRATPLNPAAPGVEVHANLAEQILLGRFLQRPDWAAGAEILYMIGFGVILLLLLPMFGAAWCALVGALGIAIAILFSFHAYSAWKFLIDPVFPSLAVLLIYMSSSLVSYLKSETERRQVKGAFSRYMSPTLVDELARHPEKLQLGGETRVMTFHFCDIRGFTTISEQFDPGGLVQFINKFLTPMTEIILKHKGVIDKYMGDCIMAFWNAPLDDPDHAKNACRASLRMHERLEVLNEELRGQAEAEGRVHIPIHIGTGLNTGSCIVGNMGSEQRFDYSVLGDDVNLASRLEGQSKTYGANIIIGPKTREMAPEFAAIELDLIRVKGKTVPVRIYGLLGDEETAKSAAFKSFQELHDRMLAAYRAKRWPEARAVVEICRTFPFPLKGLYDLYARRINAFEDAPPPAEWDGTFVATSK